MEIKQAILNQINLMKQTNAESLSTDFDIMVEDEAFNVYISITRTDQDDEL
jgi:hypothetical protein